MFAQLPDILKKEVLYHLENNNFPKAKAIHDAWLDTRRLTSNRAAAKRNSSQD